jgi:capsular exopolysaccharide synthesis family protein
MMDPSLPAGHLPDQDGRAMVPGRTANVPQDYQHSGIINPPYAIEGEAQEQTGFDIYRYIRVLLKYRWLLAGVTALAVVLAAVATFLMTPRYSATASIQIDREPVNVIDMGALKQDDTGPSIEFYQTQYELLSSRSLAERVVSMFGLASDRSFVAQPKASLVATAKNLVLGKTPEPEGDSPLDTQTAKAIDAIKDMLSVAPVRNSRVVKISIVHTSPAMAQKLANGYAEAFIADNLDRRYEASSYARKFLEERLQQLKIKLEESERQLVKYAEDQGIINLDDKSSLSASDLGSINTKLADARNERVKQEMLWSQAKNTDGFGLQEILDSKTIQENRSLRAQLAADYQQKLSVYKPAFPAMVQLRSQIKELDRQAQSEVQAIKDAIYARYMAAKNAEDELERELDQAKSTVVDQRNRSIQYNIIQREVDTNRTLYDGLLQRYKEIGVSGGIGTNNISIVDRAVLPENPSSPRFGLNLMLGLISGLLSGILLALGLDLLDDSFKAPEDVEREVGLPVVGVIPKPKVDGNIGQEVENPRSAISEAIRSLRTSLQFATASGLPKTLLVTSSKPAEGKTTTVIALAKSLAHIGLNVLLIDSDLRNASVHKRMLISNEVGLSNYLTGQKMPDDVAQTTGTDGLVVITAGPLPPNPAELLSGPHMMSLMALGAESFDIVLIDGPPVMGLADAPLLSSVVQATMLVVAANETRRNTVKVALRRLQYARANMIGVLLSKFDAAQSGYGYGYGYGDYDYHSYGIKQLPSAQE